MLNALTLQLIAIAHATVIDPGAGSTRPDMTVLVRGSRIEAVGASRSVRVPAGTRVIDATGKFLIPGLWDMHVHTDVPGGRALLGLYVANGVTGVRDMDGDLARLRAFQRDVATGALPGPRMVVSGPYLAGQRVPLPHVLVRTPEDAVTAVDSLARLRVDFVKVHNGMPPDAYFAVAREARRRRMVFAGHVFPPVTPVQASDSGQRSLEHLSGFPNVCAGDDSAVIAGGTGLQRFLLGACTREDQGRAFARLAANRTWITPTLIVQTEVVSPGVVPNDSLLHYFGDSLQALWRLMLPPAPTPVPPAVTAAGARLFEKRLALVKSLHDAGVPILTGTDAPLRASPPGFAMHDELALLVRVGLTPLEALRAATSNAARYFAATDSLGSIAVGRVADLVLLDANPLTDIANTRRISAVMANGRVFDEAGRRALLAEAQRAAHP
jgi:imidazolonepropionase-like amidohydrolase